LWDDLRWLIGLAKAQNYTEKLAHSVEGDWDELKQAYRETLVAKNRPVILFRTGSKTLEIGKQRDKGPPT